MRDPSTAATPTPPPPPSSPWSYDQAIAYLDSLVNLEAVVSGRAGPPTLDRMRRLAHVMGDPQAACPVVHITGTNGKGSTARMVSALLAAAGLSVGTYTSPDLQRVNERMARNDVAVDDAELAHLVQAVADLEPLLGGRPSRFETLTAAAFRWFADLAVDVVVAEVGLGGRWDATNVADAAVAVVTNVAADHLEVIGPTLGDVAREKAGIVKAGSHLVLGETDPALAEPFAAAGAARVWRRGHDFSGAGRVAHGGRVVELRTPASVHADVYLPVHGAHQVDNASIAVAATEAFFDRPLGTDLVSRAFAGLRLPGRLEVVGHQPLVVLDGAHNVAGARAVGRALAEEFAPGAGRVVVMGVLRGRDPAEMLDALGSSTVRLVVACAPPSPRALPAEELAAAASARGVRTRVAETPAGALEAALDAAGEDDLVLVTGSLYLVGAVRAALEASGGAAGGLR